MARTQYIYRSDDSWKVKSEGRASRTFDTQREAVAWATEHGKQTKPSQIVVFGKDAQIILHKKFGTIGKQNHPKNGRLNSKKIATAVRMVVLDRLKAADEHPS